MAEEGLAGRLGAVGERLDGVLERLIAATPEALESCTKDMEWACGQLAGHTPAPGADRQSLASAQRLRMKIRHCRRLLDQAWRFHERWAQILGATTGGYLPGGQAAAPILDASRVSLRG